MNKINRIVIAVNVLLSLAPNLLGAQALQQKPSKAVEIRVTVYQVAIRRKAGSVNELRFIPETTSKKSYQLNGKLKAFDHDGITLSHDWKKIHCVIPWSAIRKLKIKHQRKSKAGTGALVGLLVGGTAGGIIGSQVRFCIFTCSGPLTGPGIFAGSLGGVLVGATVGAVLGADSWEKLPPDQQAFEKKLLERR